TDPEKRKKLLRFTVAGAGFTGMELAGEFLEWKHVLAEEFRVNVEEVNVQVVEMLPHVLPILPDKLQKKAQKYMEKKGCEFILDSPIIRAEEGKIHTKDGTVIETNTFIWTCGVQGCEFAANLDLTLGKCSNKQCSYATEQGTCGIKDCQFVKEEREIDGKRGRLLVNDMMQSVDYEHVYLIGDVIWYQIDEKVIPQIVETAIQTAETAAKNIIADIENKEKKKHEASYHGFMVSLGGKYGVAHVMGLSLTGIFAMGMKHMINILHLFGVAGVNASWGYIKHEFLNIKHNRSFIRGLLSTKVPVYWVAVLRVFLGVMWLIEGVKKVFDGWLNPDNIYIIATEATSSATPAEGAGEQSWTAVEPLLEEPLYIYDWMVDVIISKAPFFFQATVVLAEIAIGLALIAGLFTFLAALASIGLSIMFTISAMASKEIFWYIFAAIPMLGGAGKGSGLDHWVMPFCKKLWNSTPIAKATYLYVDEPKNVKKKKGK
ncbi:MAG: FAD-dependent oxidoreductase, partial [Spirochaetia bacterium]